MRALPRDLARDAAASEGASASSGTRRRRTAREIDVESALAQRAMIEIDIGGTALTRALDERAAVAGLSAAKTTRLREAFLAGLAELRGLWQRERARSKGGTRC